MPEAQSVLGPLSDLVARCVLAFERAGETAVELELAASPDLATSARAHLEALQHAGLLLPPAAPETIGPYHVVRPLGTGGMGSVWLCEQKEPVRREVAVKVLRAGIDRAGTLARFQLERQALAALAHPNIARVLDAGVTADHRPYLVMDHVPGQPVTNFADAHRLGLRARLEVFAQICDAVQHAHQKGIVHRDIKPTNVLVVERDGAPFPVVIDFGVAKSVHGALQAAALCTLPGSLLGTPEYMSPEQSCGDVDIDTRTDIYSLGVLLYELLVGELPIESSRLQSLADLARVLREYEPPRPSARLAALATETQRRHAAARGLSSPVLLRSLRGELDWIVGRAMAKERAHRYSTAAELAQDARRHLIQEPVSAGPPSRWYVMRKFVARHRLPVASLASLGLLLLVATMTSLWFWREAVAAERTVSATNARLEQNLDTALVALDRIVGLGADGLRTPASEPVRRELLRTALELHQRLLQTGSDPSPRLAVALAHALSRAAELHLLLGDASAARAHLQQADQALAPLMLLPGSDGADLLRRCATELLCGELHRQLGDGTRAGRHFATALHAADLATGTDAAPADVRRARLRALRAAADQHSGDDPVRAATLFDEALPLARAQLADPAASVGDRTAALFAIARLCWLQVETGAAGTAARNLAEARTATAAAMSAANGLAEALEYVPVLQQFVSVAIRLRDGVAANADVETTLRLLREAVRAEPAVARHRTALGRTLLRAAALLPADHDLTAVLAMEREGLALESEGLAASGNSPSLAILFLDSLLESAARGLDWYGLGGRHREAIPVTNVIATLARAESVWQQLPDEHRRDRHARELRLGLHLAEANLHRLLLQHEGESNALRAGAEHADAAVEDHPGVVQLRMLRAELRWRIAALHVRTAAWSEAWHAIVAAIEDLTAVAPTFSQANRFGRFYEIARHAMPMAAEVGATAPVEPEELLAVARAICVGVHTAAEAGNEAERAHLATVVLDLLAMAIQRRPACEALTDASFDCVRNEPRFKALSAR